MTPKTSLGRGPIALGLDCFTRLRPDEIWFLFVAANVRARTATLGWFLRGD